MRSDLVGLIKVTFPTGQRDANGNQIGRASCRERVFRAV